MNFRLSDATESSIEMVILLLGRYILHTSIFFLSVDVRVVYNSILSIALKYSHF